MRKSFIRSSTGRRNTAGRSRHFGKRQENALEQKQDGRKNRAGTGESNALPPPARRRGAA